MIEIPEAAVIARQMNKTIQGKTIAEVIADQSPHKFAWYFGDPQSYSEQLVGKTIGLAVNYGGQVEIHVEETRILFSEGVHLRYQPESNRKHQLLIAFTDGSSFSASVQMYGGLWVYPHGTNDNPYYQVAKAKPNPLTPDFTLPYFISLVQSFPGKGSLKAFLATEQRIPGLGNGVLQDILWQAQLHPKSKVSSLSTQDLECLYEAIVGTLAEMSSSNGRNTETDFLGQPGDYQTKLSKNTSGSPCPRCQSPIKKASYLGGSVYTCDACQRLF